MIIRASRLPPCAWQSDREEVNTCQGYTRTVGVLKGRLGWHFLHYKGLKMCKGLVRMAAADLSTDAKRTAVAVYLVTVLT